MSTPPAAPPPAAIAQAAALIAEARALVVGAGAGMGIDSGLPDFRGPGGFWKAYPALGRQGLAFEEVASPATFERDPALAWGFYGHRLALYRRTVPHAGFQILRRWGQRMAQGAVAYTSNVDGHFQAAGWNTVAECHGSIHHLQCSRPCSREIWSADDFVPEVDEAACRLVNAPPRCPRCGAIARPNILMFDDFAWAGRRTRDQEAAVDCWLNEKAERLVVVEIGAGTAIPSVRRFGQSLLRAHGARLVRINPHESAVARSEDVALAGPALATLQALELALGSA
ncbi:NAD-dependent protein deacetylase of SIR2 family [Rubrivivax sp. A210]|uniref:SIR2 family NAD-dependent protein deacylase n=1 Tax=Rubrivivax sp. A210 TaxID=2772301 RepID=UPI001917B142|nr:Sir2 family NAD-dependent protein deacetylase [Rubrivivax sp. A210]CAD5374881.1 NAD-dependent protein deacetylase of SIR2 family [Rubrivivax sp. A210]